MNDNERRQAIREHFAPVVGWELRTIGMHGGAHSRYTGNSIPGYGIRTGDLPALAWAMLSEMRRKGAEVDVCNDGEVTVTAMEDFAEGMRGQRLVSRAYEVDDDPMRATIDAGIAWAKGQDDDE